MSFTTDLGQILVEKYGFHGFVIFFLIVVSIATSAFLWRVRVTGKKWTDFTETKWNKSIGDYSKDDKTLKERISSLSETLGSLESNRTDTVYSMIKEISITQKEEQKNQKYLKNKIRQLPHGKHIENFDNMAKLLATHASIFNEMATKLQTDETRIGDLQKHLDTQAKKTVLLEQTVDQLNDDNITLKKVVHHLTVDKNKLEKKVHRLTDKNKKMIETNQKLLTKNQQLIKSISAKPN